MIPLAEARAHVLGLVQPLAPRNHLVADAAGLVLAEDVVAVVAVPPFANTAMDGFAVRAADTAGATDESPVVLTVVADLHAGDAPTVEVGAGEAIRIMTGAPMPAGADAVVMVERTATADDNGTVAVLTEVHPRQHVRDAGDDVEAGAVVLRAGTVLGPGHLGVLASIGVAAVAAHPRSRVGVLSTGSELVEPGEPLGPGQIYDSNRVTLLALLRVSGFDAVDLGRVVDDEAAITAAITDAVATCDAVLTSGGVSMGDVDLVKVVLDRLGDMRWMQVAIKPAKPLAVGTVRTGTAEDDRAVPVIGLPGNPVSSVVSFELFARPALRRLAGRADDDLDRPTVIAVADDELRRRPDGKTHFARVVCTYDPSLDGGAGGHRVRSAGAQGSHQLTALAAANGLAVLPDGGSISAGERVRVLLLDER